MIATHYKGAKCTSLCVFSHKLFLGNIGTHLDKTIEQHCNLCKMDIIHKNVNLLIKNFLLGSVKYNYYNTVKLINVNNSMFIHVLENLEFGKCHRIRGTFFLSGKM